MGCLARRPVPAAILSLALALVVLLMPLLIPALDWLSTFTQIQDESLRTYTGATHRPNGMACRATPCA